MKAIFLTLDFIFSIAWFVIIASAIFSWLFAFNVVNPRNPAVETIGRALYNLTEPVYRPIRRFLPDLGGIDISPIIVLIILYFLQAFMHDPIAPMFGVVYAR